MKVYTNINTLVKVKRLLGEVGLDGLIDKGREDNKSINDLLSELLEGGKAVEFLQVITRNHDVDFGEMEPAEIKEIVTNFFTGIKEYLPESLQTRLQNMVTAKGMSS